jgi:uncharacterized protein
MNRLRDVHFRNRAVWSLPAGGLLALLLAACSIPIPQAEKDPTRFYVLSSTTATAQPRAGGPTLHLRQVDVASYLNARPMIIRRGEHEIEFREFARWGEALELGVGRVLREELLARGAATAVLAPGVRGAGAKYDFELTVRVLACEGAADGAVLFRAIWELNPADTALGRTPVALGDFRPGNLRWDGRSEASLAAQLSVAVAGLADEIAKALTR